MQFLSYSLLLFLLLLLPGVLGGNGTVICEPGEEDDCSKCYAVLVATIVEHDRNLFEIQNVFFPPNDSPPVFVTVTYEFKDIGGDDNGGVQQQVLFWTTSTFYLFQPLPVFQFTSLFFSDTQLQSSEAFLTLPLECNNASEAHMILLTERVRKSSSM